jgi:hypothetical protein
MYYLISFISYDLAVSVVFQLENPPPYERILMSRLVDNLLHTTAFERSNFLLYSFLKLRLE